MVMRSHYSARRRKTPLLLLLSFFFAPYTGVEAVLRLVVVFVPNFFLVGLFEGDLRFTIGFGVVSGSWDN